MPTILEREQHWVKTYGFFIHKVIDQGMDDPRFVNIHTHGLMESMHHHDLQIVYPIPEQMAYGFFHTLVNKIKEGLVIIPGVRYDFLLEDYDVAFILTTETDRVVLRLILPDKENQLEHDKMSAKYRGQHTVKDIP